jgi:small multidrug resistance pump
MNSVLMAWLVLGASVISEVAGTVALKQSEGFTKLGPAVFAGFFYVVAVWLMAIAMRQLEMGVTYAVWAASGTAFTALVGVAFYGEQVSASKFCGILLVLLGVFVLSIE